MRDIDSIINEIRNIGETTNEKLSKEIVDKLVKLKNDYASNFCGKYFYSCKDNFMFKGYYYLEKVVFKDGKVIGDGWNLGYYSNGWKGSKCDQYNVSKFNDHILGDIKDFNEFMKEFDPSDDNNWIVQGFKEKLANLKLTVIGMK